MQSTFQVSVERSVETFSSKARFSDMRGPEGQLCLLISFYKKALADVLITHWLTNTYKP